MQIALVAAIAENGALGVNGGLPWRLKGELGHFRQITLNHAVIMGRKTYQSLPDGALPERYNIVLSRSPHRYLDATPATSFDQALELAEAWNRQQLQPRGVVMVIGGGEIFRLALPEAALFYRTIVRDRPEADVFFPDVNLEQWHRIKVIAEQPADQWGDGTNAAAYRIEHWERT